MQIITKGKNTNITPGMRDLIERKVSKLTRYVSEIDLVEVEVSIERTKSVVDREVVEATMELDDRILRAAEQAADMRVALESVVDQLQNQLNDYRSRKRTQVRGRARRRAPSLKTMGLSSASTV